jgi:hypothetical protein
MKHINTRASWERCLRSDDFRETIWRVAKFYYDHYPKGFTDREVKDTMFADSELPHDDMNQVRPKITMLKKQQFVEEVGRTLDDVTNRKVRIVRWIKGADEVISV